MTARDLRHILIEGLLICVGFVAVAVVVVLIASSALGGSTSSTATLATGRINVTATLIHTVGRRVGPRGRQSNAVEQAWRITDYYGHPIGKMFLACRWVVPNARFCQGEIVMPRGKIVVAGSSPTAFEGEYAVTGGVGAYRGGGGSMLFQAIGIRKNVLLITITT